MSHWAIIIHDEVTGFTICGNIKQHKKITFKFVTSYDVLTLN